MQGQPAAPPDEIVRVSKELSKLEDFMECISSLKTKRKVCISFTFFLWTLNTCSGPVCCPYSFP